MQAPKSRVVKICLLILPFLLLELGLRGYDIFRGASVRGRASWYWGFTQDRYLGYRPRAKVDLTFVGGNHLDTNSEGFRDREAVLTGDRKRSLIICVGESSTWGIGCTTQQETWPNQLERLFQQDGQEIDVLNAGMPGYTTIENAQLIKLRLLKYRPDAILYMGFRNDCALYGCALTENTDANMFPRRLACLPRTFVNETLMRSSLYSLFASRLAARQLFDRQISDAIEEQGPLTPRAKELFQDQIAEIAALCKRHHVKLFWIDQPLDYTLSPGNRGAQLTEFRELLHQQLKVNEVPSLAAHDRYDFAAFPLLDEAHLSNEGNVHLAGIIEGQLREIIANGGLGGARPDGIQRNSEASESATTL